MTKVSHEVIEKSRIYLDLSEGLLNKIDLFFSNTDLTKKQQKELMEMVEEVYSESYVNAISD